MELPGSARHATSGCLSRQALVFGQEFFAGFLMVGIQRDAVYRAHIDTLRCLIVTHALSAEIGVNFIDFFALRNGAIGALGLANITIDAFVGDN
jgi:hypothetical protein